MDNDLNRGAPVVPAAAASLPPALLSVAITPEELRCALNLGWHMAEFYARMKPADLKPPHPEALAAARSHWEGAALHQSEGNSPELTQLQSDLPGLGALSNAQQLDLSLDEIAAGIKNLAHRLTAAGLAPPDTAEWRALLPFSRSPEAKYDLARLILRDHVQLLSHLTAVDPALGKAYGLGRALGDFTRRPKTQTQDSFIHDLRTGVRVRVFAEWLSDLHSLLPPHAAAAVSGSLRFWQTWAQNPTWNGYQLDWSSQSNDVAGVLKRQGDRWRELLAGEKLVTDRLGFSDYIRTGEYFVGRIRRLLVGFARQYWRALALVAGGVVFAVALAVTLLSSATAKVIASGAAILSGLGITWQSAKATVGESLRQVQKILWEAELDHTAARAVTELSQKDRPPDPDTPKPPPGLRAALRDLRAKARRSPNRI